MRERKDFSYRIVDDFDKIIDEKGNKTINLRKLCYGNSENVKLDLRQWYVDEDGKEGMGKGTSFLTDEGPHTLVEVMAAEGYGKTKTILSNIKDREDFRPALNAVLGKDDELYDSSAAIDEEEETSFYDPKQCLLL